MVLLVGTGPPLNGELLNWPVVLTFKLIYLYLFIIVAPFLFFVSSKYLILLEIVCLWMLLGCYLWISVTSSCGPLGFVWRTPRAFDVSFKFDQSFLIVCKSVVLLSFLSSQKVLWWSIRGVTIRLLWSVLGYFVSIQSMHQLPVVPHWKTLVVFRYWVKIE